MDCFSLIIKEINSSKHIKRLRNKILSARFDHFRSKDYTKFLKDISIKASQYDYAKIIAFLWANDFLCLKWVERGLNYSSIDSESPEKYQFVQHEEMVIGFGKLI